jgi:hypothetical protein
MSPEQNIARRFLWISGFAAGLAVVHLHQHNFALGAAMAAGSVMLYGMAKLWEIESRKAAKEGEYR